MKPYLVRGLFAAAALLTMVSAVHADEGMWLFNNPPLKLLKDLYGFTPPPGWLDHVRLSSVRFNSGGSGSFISPTGLVLTNHHVVAGAREVRERRVLQRGRGHRREAQRLARPAVDRALELRGRVLSCARFTKHPSRWQQSW